MPNCYLEFKGITKRFPGVCALKDVSFGIQEGQVHALIGENGAGKSTLLKILSGAYQSDEGCIYINHKPITFHSTASAIQSGIGVIYQELNLVPEMTVAQNLFLGRYPGSYGLIQHRQMNQEAGEWLKKLGEDIHPTSKINQIPIAHQQLVEIAKALARDAKILAFDEPTSSLSQREIENLFKVIRQLKAEGHVILYISHRMEEIFEICDSATILRDGQVAAQYDSLNEINIDQIIHDMVGRAIEDVYHYKTHYLGETLLECQNIMGPGIRQPVNFHINRGEILGLFGLVGAGRTELLKILYGAAPKKAGTILLDGKPITISNPSQAIRNGIVLCPEDRKKEGIIPQQSVKENINLSARRTHNHLKIILNKKWETQNAEEKYHRLGIRASSLQQPIKNLSGGNQQKTILARWLSENVKLVLFDEPTRGIDVGAKSEIYSLIYELAEQGVSVIVVSSDLPEILGVTDRILVMREGVLSGEFNRNQATQERLLQAALPSSQADKEGHLV